MGKRLDDGVRSPDRWQLDARPLAQLCLGASVRRARATQPGNFRDVEGSNAGEGSKPTSEGRKGRIKTFGCPAASRQAGIPMGADEFCCSATELELRTLARQGWSTQRLIKTCTKEEGKTTHNCELGRVGAALICWTTSTFHVPPPNNLDKCKRPPQTNLVAHHSSGLS